MKKFLLLFLFVLCTVCGCTKEDAIFESNEKITISKEPDVDVYELQGYFLMTDYENPMIVNESGPIVMRNGTEDDTLFDEVSTGDFIEISYDFIKETFPGMTTIYSCKKIEEGSIENIPESVLEKLKELGYSF